MERLKQFIPRIIDIDKIIIETPITNIKKFKRDHLIHIIHLLTEIPANKERFDEARGFVPINSQLLKKRIRNYQEYLQYLMDAKIIVSDNYYKVDYKSKGYRFTDEFISEVTNTNITDPILIQKINNDKENLSSTADAYPYLTKHFTEDLKYNYPDALNKLQEETENNIIGKVENPYEKRNYTFLNINRFTDQDFYYSVDNNIGRFHSNFTNMKGDYREFILYNGKNLVSVDISNSQPYLSSILLSQDFYNSNSTQPLNIHSLNLPHSSSPFISSHNIPTLPPPMCAFLTIDTHEDVKLFKELVRKGELYEYLEQVFKSELGLSYANRKAVKETVFTLLFTSNQYIGQEEARPKKLFKKLFPTVYEIFSYLKKKDKKFLAYILQRIESYLIYIGVSSPKLCFEKMITFVM